MSGKVKVGWEVKKLGEVLVKTESIDPTKNPNEDFTYLDVSSVNKDTKEIENATILLGKNAPSRARKLVRTNDVIFATVRPTHSRVALITAEYDEQVCSTGYFVLRGAGSRYFCERFFRAPARKISKNYATANAYGCPDSSCFTRCAPNKGCTA